MIDAHVHAFVQASASRRAVSPVFPAERSEPVEDLIATMDREHVERAVLVALPGQERYLLSALRAHRGRLAGVMTLENRRDWPEDETVDRWRSAGVRGLRITSGVDATRRAGGPEALVRRIAALSAYGLLVSWYGTEHDHAILAQLVADVPQARFVLNHCGIPRGRATVDRWLRPSLRASRNGQWRQRILALARMPNVAICLSGAYAFSRGGDYEPIREWGSELASAFGPARLMLGSDFPWIREHPGYEAELNAFAPVIGRLDDAAVKQIRHVTASRTYFDQEEK